MPTTFSDPELIRDGLVTVFQGVSTGSAGWQEVYGYLPSPTEVGGKSPFLTIRRRGTGQDMEGEFKNPTAHRFLCVSMVLAYDSAASWGSDDAEDKLDELNQLFRQTIRNNAGGASVADQLRFGAPSQVNDVLFGGKPYIMETFEIYADLVTGATP